jgi:hypothetical protein
MMENMITPKMAKEMLNLNSHNRNVSTKIVEKYARDMKNSNWRLTNQGIGIDEDNRLVDGQHRLLACVLADSAFPCIIIRGLRPDTQMVIDVGKRRSVGDQLTLVHGMENSTFKVAVANCIVSTVKSVGTFSLSSNEAMDIINLYDEEIQFIITDKKGILKGLNYAPAFAAMVLAARVDMDKAIEFKNQYCSGIGLSIGDPVLSLRNFMLGRDFNGHGGNSYRHTIMNFTLNCLMCAFQGKKLKRLTSSDAGIKYFLSRQRTNVETIQKLVYIGDKSNA